MFSVASPMSITPGSRFGALDAAFFVAMARSLSINMVIEVPESNGMRHRFVENGPAASDVSTRSLARVLLALGSRHRKIRMSGLSSFIMRTSIVVALLLAAVCAYGQGGPTPPAKRAPLQWQRIEGRDGAFSVLMPGKAEFETHAMTAKNGRPVQYSSYIVDLGRSAYQVSTSDYDEQTRISLDGAIDGVLSAWKNPLVLYRDTKTLFGHPGQVVNFTSDRYRVIVHAFAVGKRLYQLGFVEDADDFQPEHVNTFVNSFRLR
jgi:hypothetical protein